MQDDLNEALPDEIELALAHTSEVQRAQIWALFALDQRLARIVGKATEPLLAQMRLSWWRDMLKMPADDRPKGDVVLDAIGAEWAGSEDALIGLVDGWEHLLAEPPLTDAAIDAFAMGRATALAAFGEAKTRPDRVTTFNLLGQIWALADLASKVESGEERHSIVQSGMRLCEQDLPRARDFKAIAILAALGARALREGGRPLLEGRSAGLIAARAALLGK